MLMSQNSHSFISFCGFCRRLSLGSHECLHEFSKKSVGKSGFSLIEVVLAIGVFAIAVVAILGLMPGLIGQSRESWQETRAAHIARQIVEDLRTGEVNGLLVISSDLSRRPGEPGGDLGAAGPVEGNSVASISVPLNESGTYASNYDSDGFPLDSEDSGAIFRAKVQVTPHPERLGLSDVEIQISTSAQDNSLTKFRFVTRIASNQMTPPQ